MVFNCFTISTKKDKKKTIRHISSDVTVSKMVMHQFTVNNWKSFNRRTLADSYAFSLWSLNVL